MKTRCLICLYYNIESVDMVFWISIILFLLIWTCSDHTNCIAFIYSDEGKQLNLWFDVFSYVSDDQKVVKSMLEIWCHHRFFLWPFRSCWESRSDWLITCVGSLSRNANQLRQGIIESSIASRYCCGAFEMCRSWKSLLFLGSMF